MLFFSDNAWFFVVLLHVSPSTQMNNVHDAAVEFSDAMSIEKVCEKGPMDQLLQ